jgi:hypothetical protein
MDLGASSPAAVNAKTSNIFVECWVYQIASTQGGLIGTSPSSQQWVFQLYNSVPNLYVQGPGSGNSTGSVQLNRWTHVAFSWALGPTSNTAYFFIDGASAGSTTSTAPVTGNLGNVVIGNVNGYILNGYIRDLRVVQGGVVPTGTFVPSAAPFSYASPTYVANMGTTVFTLLGQFVTYNPSGKYGSSIIMGGTSYLKFSKTLGYNLGTGGATFAMWFKLLAVPSTNSWIFGASGTSYSDRIYIFTGSDAKVYWVFIDNTLAGKGLNSPSALVVGAWTHLTFTLFNGTMTMYINGAQAATRSDAPMSGVVLDTQFSLASLAAGGTPNNINAEYDDLRIYNTALTSTQVQSVYSSQGAPAPSLAMPLPILAWDFNGTSAPYTGTVSSTTTLGTPTYVSGKYNQAIFINNSVASTDTSSVNINYATSTLSTATGVTFSFWMNQSDKTGLNFNQVNVGIVTSAAYVDFLINAGTNGTIGMYGQNPAGTAIPFSYTSNPNPSVGTWYHICGVFIGTSITLYVNGVSIATGTQPTAVTMSQFYIGRSGQYNGHAYAGSVDDLRIFDRALTSAQVQSIYNQQGVPGRGAIQALTYANITAPTTYSFSSQLFSNAQATSNLGPTQSQLNTVYPSLAPTYLTSNTGIQTWTVPVTGTYSIVAAGAVGGTASVGSGTAGRGVIVGCQAIFQKNQVISIIVGQSGVSAALQTTSNIGGGGGGGSFIVDYSTGYLYIAAGGGGGADAIGSSGGTPSGFDASFGQDGVNGTSSGTSGANVSPGGTGGNGGTSFPGGGSNGNAGGGGGGFYTNGASGIGPPAQSGTGQGGFAVLNGAQGGLSSNTLNFTNSFGGFGGGGGSGGNSQVVISNGAGGGGGGGYSGGGAGSRSGLGAGGGGSYVPIGQTMSQLGYCTSNGYVSINYLAPVAVKLTGTPLFTQLSQAATRSAVGAFSLRAVNGTSAKAVNVRPVALVPPNAMTSNSPSAMSGYAFGGSGNYVASSSSSSGYQGWLAWAVFDNNPASFWENQITNSGIKQYSGVGVTGVSNTYNTSTVVGPFSTTISGTAYSGEWVQIQLPVGIVLSSYSMYGRYGGSYRLPYTWYIGGSNDGSTWSLVDSQTGITSFLNGPSPATTFTTTSTTAYTYYRMVVTAINSNGNPSQELNINQWSLYGSNASWNTDFYADRLGNLLTAPVVGQTLQNWLGGATGYVTTWYDQSGAGNHATQATAANQPVISTATTPASVVFTGNGTTSGQYLTTGNIPFSIATTGKFGVQYIIANNVGGVLATIGSGARKWWLGNGVASGAGEATQGNYPSLVGSGESYAISGTAVTSAKTSVVYNSTASGSNFYYINGSSVSLSTNTKVWNSNQDGTYPLQIGWSSTFSYYSGNLFEFIMTNTSFTASDIAVISAT